MRTAFLLPKALAFSFFLVACSSSADPGKEGASASDAPKVQKDLSTHAVAYFAAGCFWCVEEVFESVKGVEEAVSGYSGGTEQDPTYRQVGSGATGHAEAVAVYYDPLKVSYKELLVVFFCSQDPTTPNRQGPDAGPQYRSAIFYETEDQKREAEAYIAKLEAEKTFNAPIVTEVVPYIKFWPAEDYHQDYVRQHPEEGYVRAVSIPRFERFKAACPEFLK